MKRILVNIFLPVVTTILLLVAIEGGIRIYIWSKGNLHSDIDRELFELIENKGISGETFNIYYTGGSTMAGSPYSPQMSIPKIVDYMLGHKVGEREIRAVNVARPSEDLWYSLERIKRIVANRDIYHPSLFVIYSGHNEFLKFHQAIGLHATYRFNKILGWLIRHSLAAEIAARRFNLYRLEIEDRKLFDSPLFSKKKYGDVVRDFEEELKEAAELLRGSDIPVIVSTVAANHADWQPNRSIFCSNKERKNEFEHLLQKGKEAFERSGFEESVAFYQQALSICESFAEAHYLLGKSFQALGEYGRASEHYDRAVEYDGMPLRAFPSQNDFIRSLGSDGYVFVIDVVECLKQHASNGLIGFNLMIDGHHPNKEGYLLISELIARKIQSTFDPASKELNTIKRDEACKIFGIDEKKVFEICISRGRWLTRISTWRYDYAERLSLAEEFFLKGMELDPGRYESYLGLAMVNYIKRRVPEAGIYLSRAKSIDAEQVNRYLDQYWVRGVIKRAVQTGRHSIN